MNIKNLRKSILQYAVEGKLVQQDIQDEPASILYDKIIKEKETLINMRKIKKEKPLPPVTDDEIPYNIPESWKWVRLGDLTAHIDGAIKRGPFGSAIKKDIFVPYAKNTYKVYEQGNAIRKSIDYGNYFITENDYERLKSFKVAAGDILISCAGTLGETYILPENAYSGIINQALLKITLNSNIINKNFFLIIFKTITQNEIRKSSIGSAMKNMLSIAWLKSEVFFPLPPLKEQERIVKKVDELMALCDKLEQEEEKLLSLDKHFADTLPKSILQYTVEGKLVQQNIHDEPASILYDKIVKEKENLISMSKIKKERPMPPVTNDEIPYDIPENWKWVRLGEVCEIYTGNSINAEIKNKKYTNLKQGYNYIATKDVNFNTIIDYENGIKIPFNEINFKIAQKNTTLICVEGGSAGKKIGFLNQDVCFGNKLCNIKGYLLDNQYLFYFAQSPIFLSLFNACKAGIIGGVSVNLIKNILFPLPPLKEQKRIVEKVDELLTYCNKLKDII